MSFYPFIFFLLNIYTVQIVLRLYMVSGNLFQRYSDCVSCTVSEDLRGLYARPDNINLLKSSGNFTYHQV
jgi:hypothetical protein